MTVSKIDLTQLFQNSNKDFLTKNVNLLLSNVSERSLCGALKQSFDEQISKTKYKKYHVDIEYNRNQGKVKTIVNNEFQVVSVTCDLIVHSRGENVKSDNLIAIEMKKATSPLLEKEKDKTRLIALTKDSYDGVWSNEGKTFPEHVCGYALDIYYEINISKRSLSIEYYVKGENISSNTISF